jgi:hypothetical protein
MGMKYLIKKLEVDAYRWTGQPKVPEAGANDDDRWPKWLELSADEQDGGKMLYVTNGQGGYVRRGDWVVQYADGTIEVLTDHEFAQQFEEKK